MNYNLITILGPTAVGKTKLAVQLASEFNGEIISADSRQVYIGMDIGTGKDLQDYQINNQVVPSHLIDILAPDAEYNLYLFTQHFFTAFKKILEKDKLPFLAGGTGLYIHSILKGYTLPAVDFKSGKFEKLNCLSLEELQNHLLSINQELHNTTDLLDKERVIRAILIAEAQCNENEPLVQPQIHSLVLGVVEEREIIKKNITERLKYRLKNGMIEEVEALVKAGVSFDKLEFFGLEYKYVGEYLKGILNYNDMFQKLNSAIHKFAKRQMTWFRKMEREGVEINWINGPDVDSARKLILEKVFANDKE